MKVNVEKCKLHVQGIEDVELQFPRKVEAHKTSTI